MVKDKKQEKIISYWDDKVGNECYNDTKYQLRGEGL